jgi:CRP-like cAMP-binding protein
VDHGLVEKLKSFSVFNELTNGEFHHLTENCYLENINSGEIIFKQGESASLVYFIIYGAVKVLKSNTLTNKKQIMTFLFSGEFLAAGLAHGSIENYPVTAEAVESTALFCIPRAFYLKRWVQQPKVIKKIQEHLLQRISDLHDDKSILMASVPQKIAILLLKLLKNQNTIYGNRIAIKLTRRDIADHVGTSQETAIRTLLDWTSNGWITTDAKHIEIVDQVALHKVAKTG